MVGEFHKVVLPLPAVTFFLYLAVETAFQMEKLDFHQRDRLYGRLGSIMGPGAQMIVLADCFWAD